MTSQERFISAIEQKIFYLRHYKKKSYKYIEDEIIKGVKNIIAEDKKKYERI